MLCPESKQNIIPPQCIWNGLQNDAPRTALVKIRDTSKSLLFSPLFVVRQGLRRFIVRVASLGDTSAGLFEISFSGCQRPGRRSSDLFCLVVTCSVGQLRNHYTATSNSVPQIKNWCIKRLWTCDKKLFIPTRRSSSSCWSQFGRSGSESVGAIKSGIANELHCLW